MDQNLKEFYFFSEFLNRRVYNASRQRVGKITDLVAERAEPYPMIIGMMIRTRGRERYLPWEKIIQIEPQLTLSEEELLDLKISLPGEGYHPSQGRGDGQTNCRYLRGKGGKGQ